MTQKYHILAPKFVHFKLDRTIHSKLDKAGYNSVLARLFAIGLGLGLCVLDSEGLSLLFNLSSYLVLRSHSLIVI